MSKPTPRPWELKEETQGIFLITADETIAQCGWHANAAHIVKCVNMHEELLDMLRQCETMLVLDGHTERNGQSETVFLRQLRSFLTKAGADEDPDSSQASSLMERGE